MIEKFVKVTCDAPGCNVSQVISVQLGSDGTNEMALEGWCCINTTLTYGNTGYEKTEHLCMACSEKWIAALEKGN